MRRSRNRPKICAMACYNPISLANKNPLLPFVGRLVPCGKCIGCLNVRRNAWTFRLLQEDKISMSSVFLTLTYSDEFVPNDEGRLVLNKKDLQNYFKRVRHETPKIKYFGVGEYGEKTNRPHYHAIVFNSDEKVLEQKWKKQNEPIGIVQCDKVTQGSIHYVTKYILKGQSYGYKKYDPFSVMSKGLGKSYVNDKTSEYHIKNMIDVVTYPGGIKQKMPRYIKDKIFDDDMKIDLQLNSIQENNKSILEDTWEHHISKKNRAIYEANKQSKSKKL